MKYVLGIWNSSYVVNDRKGMILISKALQVHSNPQCVMMPIMAVSIQTGEVIYHANFFLHSQNEIEFFEVFENYIFLKQKEYRLVIYNVCVGSIWMTDDPKQTGFTHQSLTIGFKTYCFFELSRDVPWIF